MSIRVIVVDDHPLIVDGLRSAFGRDPAIEVVGTAGTVAGARQLIEEVAPDIALLDLRLPDGSGIELLAEYQKGPTAPAFIVLSTFLTIQYVNAAIALGASGFLLKTSPTEQIVAAIQDVTGGKLAFSADQLRASWRAGWTPLTARERDIIEGVMAGPVERRTQRPAEGLAEDRGGLPEPALRALWSPDANRAGRARGAGAVAGIASPAHRPTFGAAPMRNRCINDRTIWSEP